MAITYPLSLPSQQFARIEFNNDSAVAFSRSPFSFSTQAQNHVGQGWRGTVSWPTLNRANKAEVVAFMRKLNGPYGTFLMGVPGEETPRGTASSSPGTPVVDGAGQTGGTLSIAGAPAAENGWLLPDDGIQVTIGSTAYFHKVLNTVNTDSIGDADVDIWPDLRGSPANGSSVVVSSPVGTFRMAQHQSGFSLQDVRYTGLGFEFVEAL